MPRTNDRWELEDFWGLKLKETHERYDVARAHYRRLLEETPEASTTILDGPLAQARRAEAKALAEYVRVLKTFTELTVDGRLPEDSATMGPDRGVNAE
jgi:hypothetical protein